MKRNNQSSVPGPVLTLFAVSSIISCVATTVRADEVDEVPPSIARVPFVVINLGRDVTPPEIAHVLQGLDAPVLRGDALRAHLSLASPLIPGDADEVRRIFKMGEDLFFAGDHAQGRLKFETVIRKIEKAPHLLSHAPDLRMLAFKSHIHLAVIAFGDEKPDQVETQLRAAKTVSEFKPSRSEFPPWICERFGVEKGSRKNTEQRATITLVAPENCELVWRGRSLGRGPSFTELTPGTHPVQVRCGPKVSPIQTIHLQNDTVQYRPLLLGSSRIDDSHTDITLVAKEKQNPQAIIRDILLIAEATDQDRVVAVVGTKDRIAVWLVDVGAGRVIREHSANAEDLEGAVLAGQTMSQDPEKWRPSGRFGQRGTWYKDPVAWTLACTGAAVLGTGIALIGAYGRPSKLEPLALGFTVMGAGLFGTGITLFFLPRSNRGQDKRSTAITTYTIGVARTF